MKKFMEKFKIWLLSHLCTTGQSLHEALVKLSVLYSNIKLSDADSLLCYIRKFTATFHLNPPCN